MKWRIVYEIDGQKKYINVATLLDARNMKKILGEGEILYIGNDNNDIIEPLNKGAPHENSTRSNPEWR